MLPAAPENVPLFSAYGLILALPSPWTARGRHLMRMGSLRVDGADSRPNELQPIVARPTFTTKRLSLGSNFIMEQLEVGQLSIRIDGLVCHSIRQTVPTTT